MYSHKVLIDSEGFVIEGCVLLKDNIVQGIEIQEGQFLVNYYDKKYIKPKWDFDNKKWTEGATQEEIKEWEESNKPLPKEPTKEEQLQKQLLETQNMLLELQYKLTNKDLTNNLK